MQETFLLIYDRLVSFNKTTKYTAKIVSIIYAMIKT